MAAQLCQHESQPKSWHWGHHQHLKHGADFLDSAVGQDNKDILNHTDHIGHLDHALELANTIVPITLTPRFAVIPQSLPPPNYQSISEAPPKPPRWLPAAAGGVALI